KIGKGADNCPFDRDSLNPKQFCQLRAGNFHFGLLTGELERGLRRQRFLKSKRELINVPRLKLPACELGCGIGCPNDGLEQVSVTLSGLHGVETLLHFRDNFQGFVTCPELMGVELSIESPFPKGRKKEARNVLRDSVTFQCPGI